MGKDSNPETVHSVFQRLHHQLTLYLEKEAVYDGFRRLTYKQLFQESEVIACSLYQMDIRSGDRVIVALPNWSEFISIFLALTKIGAILIPCNPSCQKKEWDDIFSHTSIQAVFCRDDKMNVRYFKEQQAKHKLGPIICVRSGQGDLLTFDTLVKNKAEISLCPFISIDGSETAAILFTSGTTGEPKGVMLSHDNLLFGAENIKKKLHCTEKDVFYVPVPVFHVFGLIPGILASLLSGGRIVFSEKFHADQSLRIIQEEKITVHYGVPTMFILEMNHPRFKDAKLDSLRTGLLAGAQCPVNVVKKIRSDMHCNIVVSYGATETSGGVTFTNFDDDDFHRAQSVGQIVEGTQIKIVNSKRVEVPIHGVGELACRGQGVMKGYFQMPNHLALDKDGWFYTGDLARIDSEGYLYIVGRQKDMIIRGGYNIYPWEIEQMYHKHPDVEEVSVIGLPDTVLGEVICAVIKLKPRSHPNDDAEGMKNYLKEKLAACKIPDHIFFIDKMPLNGAGKIDKSILRAKCKIALKLVLR
ncbi:MAG: class I adenylate-forming enzyme family protein [Sporolactobacillus sp.]